MRRRIVCLMFVLVIAGWCSATTLNDFESYADTLALKAEWTNTANLTLALATNPPDPNVYGGLKSMRYSYNCGASPYYAKSEYRLPGVVWGVSGVDWRNEANLSFMYEVTKVKEPLHIKIMDCYGAQLYDWNLGTVPVGPWKEAVLDLQANLTQAQLYTVGRLDIVMIAVNYGTGIIYFDDFKTTVIPEPATLAMLGVGSLALIRRQRRF